MSTRLFIVFLMAAVAGLGTLSAWLARQNRDLKAQVARAAIPPGSIALGDRVQPMTVRNGAGESRVEFDGTGPAVLILHHSRECGYCETTMPVWERAIRGAAGARVRVVCIQMDARAAPDLIDVPREMEHYFGSAEWRARAPMVPSAVLVGPDGVVEGAWHGQMSEREAIELTGTLMRTGE